MPSKGKKPTDKESLWSWIPDLDSPNVPKNYVEIVYKVRPILSESTSESNTATDRRKPLAEDATWQNVHLSCRKNCITEPSCIAGLGFEKWTSGDMDYDWPSDDEDDDCLVKRKKEIPVGLMNLGATCYVNAFLQLWFHNLAFRNAVLEWTPYEDGGFSICETLQFIFGLLELSHRSCVDPSPLIETLGLDTSQQQDAQEFSKLFIDLLPCPQIKEMFSGTYDYVTRCSACKTDSCTPSQFNELDLSIEGHATLDDCMKSFLQVEKLTGDNQYFCSKCQSKQNATRRIKLRKLPAVLNIQLLRFVFDRKTGHKKKLNTLLQFPDQLDLTDILPTTDGEKHEYELSAVLLHTGVTAFSGHYTAHVRKLDHWYSFNDANVSKLKGKKLNLSNEESMDLNPDGSLPANDSRKKGNRSKTAYMLVYQRKEFIQATKDLQPSPVPQRIMDQVNEDNKKMTVSNHYVELKQTEQMVRVDIKKDQLKDLSDDIGVQTINTTENYHFLPLSWLNDIVKDWEDIKPIDNRHILCRHGKLNWAAHSKYKLVSQKQGEMIYNAYSGEHTTKLNRADSLCYQCVQNQMIWRKAKQKTELDSKRITSLLSSEKTGSNSNSNSLRYWLSKTDLRRWKSLVLKPLEKAAVPADKVTSCKPECEAAASEKPTDNLNADTAGSEKPTQNGVTEEPHDPTNMTADPAHEMNGVNDRVTPSVSSHSNSSENGDTDDKPADDKEDAKEEKFNEDVLCEHGNLDPSERHRQLVSQHIWDILLQYFPGAITMTQDKTPCHLCLGEQEVQEVAEVQRKTLVKEHRQVLCDLASLKNRPVVSHLSTPYVYCIAMPAFKQWKQFLRNPNTQSSMEVIDNSSIICPHNKLSVCLPDENSSVLLWPYEWDVLSKHFPYDHLIKIQRSDNPKENGSMSECNGITSTTTDLTSYTTEPEMCRECIESRLLTEELELHHFDNARVYLRLIDDDKDDKKTSTSTNQQQETLSAAPPATEQNNTTDEDEEQPDDKKLKIDPLLPSGSSLNVPPAHKRRSIRRKHVRGDKQIRLSSSTTLKELRVEVVKLFAIAPFDQILTVDGRKLEGDVKSLAELKLYPDCLILLQGQIYDDTSIEQALVEQQVLEEGFRGTGLFNNTT